MSENKTKPTKQTVAAYLKAVDPKHTNDCKQLIEIMSKVTGEKPKMWGPSIIGFGSYHYVYDSGREGDSMLCGFSPRKAAISVYIMSGFDKEPELMEKLGKFKTGKSCLYIKSLDDVHVPTLKKLITASVKYMKKKYPG
ncbi:MAG: DUF1801 domain-containing protein [Phycisphaerales bacterium]|nr:DUF1801 domain-containing protein [Phycisphaerales bacterium]